MSLGAYSSTYHPDWSTLAARIVVSDLHKQTESSFSKNSKTLHAHLHPKTGAPAALIADDVAEIIEKNAARLDAAMHYERIMTSTFLVSRLLNAHISCA
jgi:ribonucleoside-diphosphate reductase subunit M1